MVHFIIRCLLWFTEVVTTNRRIYVVFAHMLNRWYRLFRHTQIALSFIHKNLPGFLLFLLIPCYYFYIWTSEVRISCPYSDYFFFLELVVFLGVETCSKFVFQTRYGHLLFSSFRYVVLPWFVRGCIHRPYSTVSLIIGCSLYLFIGSHIRGVGARSLKSLFIFISALMICADLLAACYRKNMDELCYWLIPALVLYLTHFYFRLTFVLDQYYFNSKLRTPSEVVYTVALEPVVSDMGRLDWKKSFLDEWPSFLGSCFKYRIYILSCQDHPLLLAVNKYYFIDRMGTVTHPPNARIWSCMDEQFTIGLIYGALWLFYGASFKTELLFRLSIQSNILHVNIRTSESSVLQLPYKISSNFKDYRICANCNLVEKCKKKNKSGLRISSFKVCRVCKRKGFHRRYLEFPCHYCSQLCMISHWSTHRSQHVKPSLMLLKKIKIT